MPDISSAIEYIREYQSARESLASEDPPPIDYDSQVVDLRDTLMANLNTAGFPSLPSALSAISEVYPPSCGDCRNCCAEYWPDCGYWDGTRCTASKTPDQCMVLCEDCMEAIQRNWPGSEG